MIRKYRYGTPFNTEALTEKIETTESTFPYGEISQNDGFAFTYIMDEDDIVYGLGESNRGINKRGYCYISNCTDDPVHTEDKRSLYGAHNFIVVSGKTTFGLFFDYPSELTFDIGYTRMDTLKVSCENADLDIYVIEGENAYDIVKQFRHVIGRSYIPPKFAFGFGQSRWGYTTKEDFRAVAKGYRENHIPIDMIYMDIDYMQSFKDFTVSEENFPDFPEFVQEMLKKYDFWNNESYINAIIEASKKYNVNVYYVIARILQEQGNGTSPLVKGEGYNDQYVGVYNVFNIGASGSGKDNVILNGLARAEQEGWTSIELSIDGGVEFISKGYINRGQNTMYLQKFDVDSSEAGLYWHQYQQNIMAPQNEGTKLRVAFEECESIDMDYTFIIPVYKNMPNTACERPNTDNNETPEIDSNLVKCNANPSLRLRDNPNGTYIGEKIYLNEVVTVIEKATEKVAGTYWDFVRKSNGVEGYAARSTSDDEPVYKLYLVPVKEDNGKDTPDNPTPDVPENPDDENKEIVENEKIRTNNTTNEITSIPNSTITDLKELLGAEIVVKNSNGEVVSNESNLATGYVVNDKYTISVLGDVSGDGVVDARDSLRILKYAVGTYELNNEYAKSADLNKDGIIDARDSLRILKYAVDTYKIEL